MHLRSIIFADRTSRRRTAAVASAAALAATTLLAGTSADAAVVAGGGRNADRTPVSFHDSQGLAVQMCIDARLCEPADAAAGDIGSYFSAEAQVGPVRAIWGIDAAFLEDAAGNLTNRPAVTNSALFRAEGLRPHARYTIEGPWGTHRCVTNADGALDNKNCIFGAGGEEGGTVAQGPVESLLFPSRAPRGFLGNLTVPQTVTGSPSGFNRVVVTGPGLTARANRFVLGGQLAANQPMSLLGKTALRLGSKANTRTVTKTLRLRSVGTAPVRAQIRKAGANPVAFKVTRTCGAVAPGRSCAIQVSYNPGAHDKKAVLVINDNTLAAPRRVTLTGIAPR
jgi:hypothetical protein